MRLYSVDFRQKIIDVWKKKNFSIRGLAQRFDVAKSFIQKLLKQHEETGDIRPRPQGGSPPTKLNSEQLIILIEIIGSSGLGMVRCGGINRLNPYLARDLID
jgi:transposase